ncbi:MAG: hypothetical protein LIP77_09790, partial [Planctomycetes bacterium]|nr:hypothetical protein [Planctomycetota bacterium]
MPESVLIVSAKKAQRHGVSVMGKVQGKLRTLAEYAGLLTAYALLAWPPLVVSRGIARLMADAWRRLDRRHRRRAEGQCRERLGVSRAEARRLIRDNYRHYAKIVMEVARLRRMPIAEVMRRTDTNGCDHSGAGVLPASFA